MTTTKKSDYPAAVDHNTAMIEELRANPDYADAYLLTPWMKLMSQVV